MAKKDGYLEKVKNKCRKGKISRLPSYNKPRNVERKREM